MPETIFGLPLHPLIVHATVVLVPLAALTLLVSALVPRFRRWAGVLTPGIALVALVLDPLSTSTGENLAGQIGTTPAIQQHAEYADGLVFWVFGVTALAGIYWWLDRRAKQSYERQQPSRKLAVVLAGLTVVAVLGTVVQIVLIGHSGAQAAWSGVEQAASHRTAQTTAGNSDAG